MEDIHVEKLEEAATHTTDEARMILPGVQAIMGFQLIAVFNQRFETLDAGDQAVHLAAFFLITLAMGLLMTPAAYHRLAERGSVTKRFVNLASGLIAFALLPLLIGLAMNSYVLVLLVSHDATVSLAAGIGLAGALAAMWFGLPFLSRRASRGGRGT